MDPAANLRAQEWHSRKIQRLLDAIAEYDAGRGDADFRVDEAADAVFSHAGDLAELVLAYLAWRKKGGSP